jgi:hypothetical protein
MTHRIFTCLIALVAVFFSGILRVSAQEPELGRKQKESAQIANPLQQRAQSALRSGELEAVMAYARSVLELIARDPEAAAAITRAASAESAQRAAALQEANLTIKTKSSPPRMSAPREEVVQEIADVTPAGKFIKIKFKRCKKSPDGTETCTEVVIEI